MADFCHGNGEDHCCYVNGQVCPFLEEDTVAGRHWVCGKRRALGSWAAVHDDPEYIEVVGNHFEGMGVPLCGDFMGVSGIEPQCCYADQYPLAYNLQGRGPLENAKKHADKGPGTRAAGISD